MLKMIDEVLDEILNVSQDVMINSNIYVKKLLDVMEYDMPMSANEIMKRLGIESKETLRSNYLNPAIKEGLVKLTIPDKSTSKNQMYYKI